jgi:hypothetical protein
MQMRPDEPDDEDEIPQRILRFEATEDEVIAWYMTGVLERAGGNQCEAQRVLAIDRSTIRRRIEKFGLRRSSKSSRSDRSTRSGHGTSPRRALQPREPRHNRQPRQRREPRQPREPR